MANAKDNAKDTAQTVFEKVENQYFEILEQGQAATLSGYEQVASKFNTLPGTEMLGATMDLPAKAVEAYFGFASKLIDNQHKFAQQVLAAANTK